jgi:hypothetical protein
MLCLWWKKIHTIINNIQYIIFEYNTKNMKTLLKLNPKHCVSNDYDMIPQELIIDIVHIHL